jgi:hypothetical protein
MKQAIKQNFVGVVITVFLYLTGEEHAHTQARHVNKPFCPSGGHMPARMQLMRREFNVKRFWKCNLNSKKLLRVEQNRNSCQKAFPFDFISSNTAQKEEFLNLKQRRMFFNTPNICVIIYDAQF